MKIFQPWPDNVHYPVLWSNPADFFANSGLNFESLKDSWRKLSFEFYREGKLAGREPDLVFLAPCIAIKKEFSEFVFSQHNRNIELLPISISGEEWVLVNCLSTVQKYNEDRSIVHKDSSGTIYMVQKLVLDEFPVGGDEVFTMSNSNRSSVLVIEPFVDRVKDLKLKGLQFKQIGAVA